MIDKLMYCGLLNMRYKSIEFISEWKIDNENEKNYFLRTFCLFPNGKLAMSFFIIFVNNNN